MFLIFHLFLFELIGYAGPFPIFKNPTPFSLVLSFPQIHLYHISPSSPRQNKQDHIYITIISSSCNITIVIIAVITSASPWLSPSYHNQLIMVSSPSLYLRNHCHQHHHHPYHPKPLLCARHLVSGDFCWFTEVRRLPAPVLLRCGGGAQRGFAICTERLCVRAHTETAECDSCQPSSVPSWGALRGVSPLLKHTHKYLLT